MFDRKHIESILKINGLACSAPDEEIRSMLLSASFREDELETAIKVLRETARATPLPVDGLHKVFRSDQALQPAEIAQLLGINIDIKSPLERQRCSHRHIMLRVFLLWCASVFIAASAVMLYMYTQEIGLFHPSSTGLSTI